MTEWGDDIGNDMVFVVCVCVCVCVCVGCRVSGVPVVFDFDVCGGDG